MTVLSPGNVKLLLVIPWVLVLVTDLWLNVFMEAEIVKVGTVEASRTADAGTTEVGTVEAGKVGNSELPRRQGVVTPRSERPWTESTQLQ